MAIPVMSYKYCLKCARKTLHEGIVTKEGTVWKCINCEHEKYSGKRVKKVAC